MTQAQRVFVSGIFNVLHPGHVRLLRFAKSLGRSLVVGVLSDELAGNDATVPEQQRLEAVESLRMVSHAVIIRDSTVETVASLRPEIVVKGREHQFAENREMEVLRKYGGALVFSSGDSFFNVTDLLFDAQVDGTLSTLRLPFDFVQHHGITRSRLGQIIEDMQRLRVLVVGDVIVDEYVNCHPLGMSREDPTIVVTPIETRRYIGGAAIVAAHASSLGRVATLHSVAGEDHQREFLRHELDKLGVAHQIHVDASRPTTTKQRFRSGGKTLLRVSHLRQESISEALQSQVFSAIERQIKAHDLLIFSDFNYGALPQPLVDKLTAAAKRSNLTTAADSQTSSQVGDISRYVGMDLLTPTEYEARVALRQFEDGLVVLADQLRERASAGVVMMTLAEDGLFIRGSLASNHATTDRIPALNSKPVDVAGAGDSLLVVAAMAMAAGANYHEAALLGSVGAAIQVSATGNCPLSTQQLLEVVRR